MCGPHILMYTGHPGVWVPRSSVSCTERLQRNVPGLWHLRPRRDDFLAHQLSCLFPCVHSDIYFTLDKSEGKVVSSTQEIFLPLCCIFGLPKSRPGHWERDVVWRNSGRNVPGGFDILYLLHLFCASCVSGVSKEVLYAHTAANPVLLQESGGRDSGGRHCQHAVPV